MQTAGNDFPPPAENHCLPFAFIPYYAIKYHPAHHPRLITPKGLQLALICFSKTILRSSIFVHPIRGIREQNGRQS